MTPEEKAKRDAMARQQIDKVLAILARTTGGYTSPHAAQMGGMSPIPPTKAGQQMLMDAYPEMAGGPTMPGETLSQSLAGMIGGAAFPPGYNFPTPQASLTARGNNSLLANLLYMLANGGAGIGR